MSLLQIHKLQIINWIILDKYENTKGMIIDIRQNGGGYAINVPILLSRFTHEDTKIYETQIKTSASEDGFLF